MEDTVWGGENEYIYSGCLFRSELFLRGVLYYRYYVDVFLVFSIGNGFLGFIECFEDISCFLL